VDALEAVSAKFLADLDVTPPQRAAVSDACRCFHEDISQLSEQFKCEEQACTITLDDIYLAKVLACPFSLSGSQCNVHHATLPNAGARRVASTM
jgi:hypothetical protein